jgi:hypothetical protein
VVAGKTPLVTPAENDENYCGLACFDFACPPLADEVGIFMCRRVWEEELPVKYVSHDRDGQFQFLCGGNEHTDESACVYIHASHILERGPEQLRDFTYLKRGFCATHIDGERWELNPLPPDEDAI